MSPEEQAAEWVARAEAGIVVDSVEAALRDYRAGSVPLGAVLATVALAGNAAARYFEQPAAWLGEHCSES